MAPLATMYIFVRTQVQTFSAESLGYKDFFDGLVLNNCIMKQIDAKAITDGVVADPEDLKERLHNWNTLLQNIKTYYQEVLQQLIVMRLPNIVTISRSPESGEAQAEMQRMLLLLLGCAIQCEKKELFIDNIKKLPINTQHAIVDFIKDITDDSKNVFAMELPSQHANEVTLIMHRHLCSLVDERDGYIEEIKDLNQTLEEMYQSQQVLQAQKGLVVPPASSPEKQEKQHLIMELAESKAKARKLRQQLEEKTELASELQEEIDELKTNLSKLRNENLQLTQDARAARTYRDELDIVREKASRVDKFESEISKYKEKLNELDFYKARVEELREENTLISDAKNLLEDQLEASHRRGASVHDLENTVARCRQQLNDMTAQRDDAQERLLELMEENARLELEKRSSFNESASLEEELQQARLQVAPSGLSNSLSEQLSETANAKILRLELENQRLQKQLSEMRDSGAGENNALVLELEKENHRLARKVEHLQSDTSKSSEAYIALEQLSHELGCEKTKLLQTIETVRASSERETQELEREKEQVEHTVETLRKRNEKTHDLRLKDLETENKALDERVRESMAQLSKVTFEHRQLTKSYEQLQVSLDKMEELEQELRTAQREKDELSKSVVTMQLTCDKYEELERDHSDLEVEKMRLVKVVEGLKATIARLKTVEQDNINLTVESQQLRRSVDNMRAVATNVVDLEQERDELTAEVEQLKKALSGVKVDRSRQEELHVELMRANGANQKLQRSIEAHAQHLERTEKEAADLENQNQKLSSTLEEMRVSLHRLDMLEKENADLEAENVQLQREKAGLEKEKTRLGKQAESKAALLEEATETVTHLQRQNKVLQKTVTKAEDSVHRLSDVEQENVTLRQQASTERKMVSTLREDLVNEKIKTQHLSNELESITEELEKVGLNKEKIIAMEQAEDDSKYKALESMMEDAFQRSMQLKEEKICALQSRLDASRTHNQKLQEDLKAVRNQYEALQQRREEEASVGNSPNRHRPVPVTVTTTRDVFELKDHVIAVERANAALEAENNHLKSHIDDLQLRLDNTESRSVKLQMQVSSMQGQQSSQQTQLAKLQVEVTTLQSQNASLASQNAMLQKQLASLESERKELVSGQEELQSAHESLVLDHNALQHLHEQLSSEYEALISEHGSLKANHKSLRSEHKSLQEQQMLLERDRQSVNDAKKILALEQEHLQSASRSSSSLQSEFARLAEEKARLENSHKALSVDYRDEVAAHKATKTQLNQLTAKYDQLQATRSEANGQLTAMEFEVSKLVSKCETMDHLNSKLEDENRTLMMQLQALLTQNQELLTQSLDSKDHFHEEQRGYLEKLAELRRQKEKLEEKIMEQYKRYDPVKRKSRGFGANLVRKAKGMMGRRSQSKDNSKDKGLIESGLHNSPENSSLGSGSVGESDGHTDSNYNKKYAAKRLPRHRRNNRSDSPKLAKQNKALAKSTNALAAFRKDSTTDGFSLRGAKSSENLIDGDEFSRAGSLSSSNSSARHAEWPARQGKRRQLLGSTSGPLGYRTRQSSVSSEDTGQQDEDDMMTLDQFLSECNRSPTSRRKWLQSTGDLRGEIETDKCTTDVLSPDLGARPAVPQPEDTKHVSVAGSDASDSDHKGATRVPHSRSELNISRLSQISSTTSNKQTPVTSGGSDYAQWQPRSGGPEEVTTSTPNRYPQYTVVDVSQCMRDSSRTQPTLRSVTPLSHVMENSHGRYSGRPVAASESFHNSMNSTPTYLDMNTAGYHSPAEYSNSRGGVASQQNSQMLPRQSSNVSTFRRSNSMKRQPHQSGNGGTVRPQQQQLFNSGTAVTSVRNTDAYSGVKRQVSCATPSSSNGSNTLPKRGGSVNDRSTRYDAIYSKIPVDQSSPDVSIYATSPRRPTTPRMSNPESLDSNDSAGSYHPGNVRNLVQSYQQTVHQQAIEGPVPPPRRTRPLSAGPGSGPTFTDNAVQPHQRPYTPLVPSSDLVQRRTLPQPPDGSAVSNRRLSSPPANDVRGQNAGSTTPRPTQRGDAPGNTPPRPQGGALEPPKNSIWSLSYHGSSTIR